MRLKRLEQATANNYPIYKIMEQCWNFKSNHQKENKAAIS